MSAKDFRKLTDSQFGLLQLESKIVVMVKILLLSLLLTISCRGRKEFTRPGYIIGPTNDIERLNTINFANIDIDSDVLESAKQSSVLVVTRLENGRAKHCSGSLVEAKEEGESPRVVTNHHCFAKKLENENRSLDELIPEACIKTKVYFTTEDEYTNNEETTKQATGQREGYQEFPCKKGSLQTNYGADLAIFTIDGQLPAEYQPFKIWQGVVPANRPAFIIHHPSAEKTGDEKEKNSQEEIAGLTLPTKAITDKNCQVIGRFEEELWYQNPNLPFGLRHTCDLVKGSSGSGLIDAQTGHLLGVNWGGITFTINSVERKDNVASSAEFLEEFVNEGKVTEPPMPPRKDDSQWLCGVIADHSPLTSTLLLILPLLVGFLKYQSRF